MAELDFHYVDVETKYG